MSFIRCFSFNCIWFDTSLLWFSFCERDQNNYFYQALNKMLLSTKGFVKF